MDNQRKQRKYRKLHCPHCDKSVSKSTWYTHYSEFFDCEENKWKTDFNKNSDGDFDFGVSDSGDSGRDDTTNGCGYEDPDLETQSEVIYLAILHGSPVCMHKVSNGCVHRYVCSNIYVWSMRSMDRRPLTNDPRS